MEKGGGGGWLTSVPCSLSRTRISWINVYSGVLRAGAPAAGGGGVWMKVRVRIGVCGLFFFKKKTPC